LPRRDRVLGAVLRRERAAEPVLGLALAVVAVVARHQRDLLLPPGDRIVVLLVAPGVPAEPPHRLGHVVAVRELDRQRRQQGLDLLGVAQRRPLLGLAQQGVVGVAVLRIDGLGGLVALDRGVVLTDERVGPAGLVVALDLQIGVV